VPGVKFKTLLDPVEPAQPTPESFKLRIFVIVGLEIFLEGAHGIKSINPFCQGAKKRVIYNSVPGFIGQLLGIMPV
jgi:hypothetical protein